MLKSSVWIKEQCEKNRLLEPFVDHSQRNGVISFGLGPYGYDLRLDREYKQPGPGLERLDPHRLEDDSYQTLSADIIEIPAGQYILGKSVEYFRMPRKVLGLVFGKSTYSRAGILVNVTPLEPEWSGYLTMAIANTASLPAVLYPGQGIAQVIFLESDDLPLFSYRDLNGKYDQQSGITVSKI